MDKALKDLFDEARRLFKAGMYTKAEGKLREVIRLAKKRGDNVALADGYMLLANCLERLKKVIPMQNSRESGS
jgi:tetratricopeptide (TPR) repeat protein